jgi:phytoene synthase
VSVSVEAAYKECESIARREAKNFYYAFRVLPKPKRRAICAVYAFMRHADDLTDDERLPRDTRLEQTQQWLAAWRHASSGEATDDPVFIALRDAQQRFQIPAELLDQLVQGTMMDLTTQPEQAAPELTEAGTSSTGAAELSSPLAAESELSKAAGLTVYRTFDELYHYCYLVASVVGLVCIRIFGYTDARAEELAEQTGVAFQLTNILRDVREDAERGRIYLPLEDLESHSVTVEQLASIRDNRQLTLDERALMEMEAARARQYYAAADSLLPLIAPDSRAALWVLVTIYRRLLDRIVAAQYQVFGKRIKLPTVEKIWILLCGLWMAFRLRGAGAR